MAFSKELNLDKVITSGVVGVALIISNDYVGCHGVSVLKGTHKDSDKLEEVFKKFRYYVHKEENATLDRMNDLFETLTKYKYPSKFRRLVFAFAGHGDDGILLCQDGENLAIEDMISQFKPSIARNDTLAHVVRMFFIDACRGSKKDAGYTARGDDDDLKCLRRVPNENNVLIAYSSTRYHSAFEDSSGGLWTGCLAEELTKSDEGLSKILIEVNNKLSKHQFRGKYFQTAEYSSRLTEEVYFMKEAGSHKPDELRNVQSTKERRIFKRNIIVVGSAGAGKSNLVNQLVQENVCKVSASFTTATEATTTVTRSLHIDGDEYQCTFIDTIGVMVYTNTYIIIKDITQAIESVGELNLFVYVFKHGRFTQEEKEALSTFLEHFSVQQIAALVITSCEGIGGKARAQIVESCKQDIYIGTKDIATQMSRGIYTVGFPDLNECDEDCLPLIEKWIQKDRSKLFQLIAESSTSIPAKKIIYKGSGIYRAVKGFFS